MFFFFEVQKLKALDKTSQFFASFLAFITLFQLLVVYVFKNMKIKKVFIKELFCGYQVPMKEVKTF